MSGSAGRVAQFLEVQAGAEHRVGAGEDDDVDVLVGLGVGAARRRTGRAAPNDSALRDFGRFSVSVRTRSSVSISRMSSSCQPWHAFTVSTYR